LSRKDDPKTSEEVLLRVRPVFASEPRETELAADASLLSWSDDWDDWSLDAASFLVGDEIDEAGRASALRFGDGAGMDSRRLVDATGRASISSSLDDSGSGFFVAFLASLLGGTTLDTGGIGTELGTERVDFVVTDGSGLARSRVLPATSARSVRRRLSGVIGGGNKDELIMGREVPLAFALKGELVGG
jgi:hypothetical protein